MPCVLIVDDDQINAQFMKQLLMTAHPDYTYHCAFRGMDVFELVLRIQPDIILLDVLMPDISGFEVCEKLKADKRTAQIPVLLITGLDTTAQKIVGFKAGAADYITKPLNVDELKARVDVHLRIKQYQDELVRAQAVMVEQAKMSAIGSLAAGVAHEFNNILLMMSGYVQLYKDTGTIEELKQTLSIIDQLVVRGMQIVRGLLDFSRKDEFQKPQRVQLKPLIEQDIVLLSKEFQKRGIGITTKIDDLPEIMCFPSQIAQVVINILKNAMDAVAVSHEKHILVRGYLCTKEKQCARECGKDSGSCIVLDFSDSGPGIPKEIRDKIFEPFVTTKGVVGGGDSSTPGTGLGLSISYGIIQRHKGTISAISNEGEGTTIRITLPVETAAL